MAKSTFIEHLTSMGACVGSLTWVRRGNKTAKQAWEDCQRADWLLWWCAKESTDLRDLIRVSCKIARTVVYLSKDPTALQAIEAAEEWAENPTGENIRRCEQLYWIAFDTVDNLISVDTIDKVALNSIAASTCPVSTIHDYTINYYGSHFGTGASVNSVARFAALATVYSRYNIVDEPDHTMEVKIRKYKKKVLSELCPIVRETLKQPWTEV